MGRPQLLQHRRVGRVAGLRPLALRQVELEEQDLLELLGAAEVELVADVDVDLLLEAGDLRAELAVEHRQRLAIERDADRLHPGEDRDERQLDLAEEPVETSTSSSRSASGSRTAIADSASRPARAVGRQLGRRRQDLVELLGDDVGDRLAAQRGVEDVGGDLGVERDRQRLRRRDPRRSAATRTGLTSWPTSGMPSRSSRRAQRVRRLGALGRDDATVGAGHRERERRPAPRPRIVLEQRRRRPRAGRRATARARRSRSAPTHLDPARIDDRGGQRRRQVVGRLEGPIRRPSVRRRCRSACGVAGDRRSKSSRSCSSPLSGRADGPAGAPALGPAGDLRRRARSRSATTDRRRLRPLLGDLAGHRRQPLDERPELVLAEQPDDRVAVVVAEAGGLEVERDRQVADDRRELAAHEDLVAVLAELVAQLLRRDLVEPREQRVEVAELADQLRRGLLADAGHARDVVGRVALERLVVDHLVGPQPEALVDPGDVVDDGVLDAGAGRHQPDARRDELEHVEVDGDDRRLEVLAAARAAA